jgi:motility quorum-sensing regulator / GCU-specific mRNA interferase toxin
VRIQEQVRRMGAAAFTKTALDGGREMGLTAAEMLAVISSLSRRNFYKSMTTYADHRVWQDVYHADTPVKKQAYIKITLRDMAPVIQFKES